MGYKSPADRDGLPVSGHWVDHSRIPAMRQAARRRCRYVAWGVVVPERLHHVIGEEVAFGKLLVSSAIKIGNRVMLKPAGNVNFRTVRGFVCGKTNGSSCIGLRDR